MCSYWTDTYSGWQSEKEESLLTLLITAEKKFACHKHIAGLQPNCMSFRFSLDSSRRQSIFWSTIWGPVVHIFYHQQMFTQDVLTALVLMPMLSTISCALPYRFCNTVFSTARQFSSQLIYCYHRQLWMNIPAGALLEGFLLRQQNYTVQCVTKAYDGTSSLYITVICLFICCSWMFSSVKNILSLHNMWLVTVGDCAFTAAGSRLWDSLPPDIRST